MPFCTKCGKPLTGAFCTSCGARAQAPSAQSQPQPQPAPVQTQSAPVQAQPAPVQPSAAAAAAPKKSGAGKALAIGGGIVLLFIVVGIAGVWYTVHWVKNKVSSATGGAIGGSSQVRMSSGNMCSLLSRDDLQQVLGISIEKTSEIMEGSDPGCAYYTNPDGFATLQKMALAQAKKDSEQASKSNDQPKTDNPMELMKHTKEMEGIVKGFGLSQPDKDGKVFSFSVQRDYGRNNWSALRTTMSIVPGFEDVNGVGDRAMIGSFGHALYVLKGDSVVHLDTMYVPEARTRGSEIGRRIVSHL